MIQNSGHQVNGAIFEDACEFFDDAGNSEGIRQRSATISKYDILSDSYDDARDIDALAVDVVSCE